MKSLIHSCLSFVPPVSVVLYAMLGNICSFNLNVHDIKILSSSVRGNTFGSSAALYTAEDGGIDAIIGAPERMANRSQAAYKTGKVYTFKNIFKEGSTIGEESFQKSSIDMPTATKDEAYGSTVVAADSKLVLVCSPAWKDTQSANRTYPIGRCTLRRSNSSYTEFKPYYISDVKRDYATMINGKNYYYYGMATTGFSADIDKRFIAIGAPGILNFEGSVIGYNLNSPEEFKLVVQRVYNLNTTSYGYVGYSVKLGRFCADTSSFCVATGAPNMFNVGQVRLLERKPQESNEKYIKVIQEINGTDIWSSFGYSLGVVNINRNSYDELLVGAPLYTEWSDPDHVPDQGMVFLYQYDANTKKYERKNIVLDGSKLPYARFGSAITEIGDINLDGISDIVIGAPGENDGAGSIYIYLGSLNGFVNVPSQRIQASQIPGQVKGFGFAFSNKEVPLNKAYPVFAATSVVSETVAVFRCRPIVEVEATLIATPNPVDTKVPCNSSSKVQGSCMKIRFCLKHGIKRDDFKALNYSIHLDIDTKIKAVQNKRALFRNEKNESAHSVNKSNIAVRSPNSPACNEFLAVLQDAQINKDRFTPIIIVADFRIEPSQNPANDPVLDETKASNRTLEVTFVNECGSDAKCEVDLSVNANLAYVPLNTHWTHAVVNLTKEITLKVNIKNKNDPSYGTVATIELDSYVPFIKARSDPNCDTQATGTNTTDISLITDKLVIICSFFEPLDSTGEITFNVLFDIEQADWKKDELKIKTDVMPKSSEHNPEISLLDNTKTLNAKIYIVANITLESLSTPTEHTIYDVKNKPSKDDDQKQTLFNITHKILVRNNGPSFLPKTEILVKVPIFLSDETRLVTKADVKMSTPSGEIHCQSNTNIDRQVAPSTTTQLTTHSEDKDLSSVSTLPSTTTEEIIDIVNRKRRAVDNKCQGKMCFLRCQDNHNLCQLFTCELNANMRSNSYAEINVTLVLDLSKLYIKEEFNTLQFVSDVIVKEPKHPLFKSWGVIKQQETITTFHFIQSGGKINIWIIIGSVIAGLVLITIIVIILWKIGFFKRTKHLEVQRQKRESMRRSMKATLHSQSDD
ncbi:integrin alpha-4 [Biomphalaria pfeifferi]|uniref:Integrin alpha-4 n=1 Tax=Biomphalaria pfeifferi TaxID=112525 RepID=A0AAD8FQN2_BIOPF|nr:integrin alpha-4 [Biomphalaria pfeifferi]